MAVLDLAVLNTGHLLLFGAGFILVYAVAATILRHRPTYLRQVRGRPQVYFGGSILVGIIVSLVYLHLGNSTLAIGLLAAGLFILLVGAFDERQRISPAYQLMWQLLIIFLAVVWGWSIPHITNVFGSGVISFAQYSLGPLIFPGSIITIIWVLLILNAFNWLDGVDGLASGVGAITLLCLALISLLPAVQNERTLGLALIGAGCLLGFLLWNVFPAKLYLGTTGSWMLGLYIALVAILGGGKIVTTLLVMVLPVADLLAVSMQRILAGIPPWRGDRERHLHFRLLAANWSPKWITTTAVCFSALLGLLAIVLQTQLKLLLLTCAIIIVFLVSLQLALAAKKKL